MDQKPPQLSVADVKEEVQDVLISDVDGAGHSSPDKNAESTVCPVFNGEVKEETVFQDMTELVDGSVRPLIPAPSASPRPTTATLPGPLNLAILIQPPVTHTAGPSAVEDDSHLDIAKAEPEIKHRFTLLLLATIKKHRPLYNTNKPAFYRRVHKEMLQRNHKFSVEQIRKKISNMLATYKRVKHRCQTTGEAAINWDYYTIMDDLFGRSGVGAAPGGRITSTVPSTPQPSAPEPDPAVLTKKTATDGATGRKPASQAASFFESYEAHAERRTAVLESLVRPDLERFRRLKESRRRSFEKKVLTSLGQISKSMQEIAEGQQEFVKLLQNLQHK